MYSSVAACHVGCVITEAVSNVQKLPIAKLRIHPITPTETEDGMSTRRRAYFVDEMCLGHVRSRPASSRPSQLIARSPTLEILVRVLRGNGRAYLPRYLLAFLFMGVFAACRRRRAE
jgi:hypothetical protein